MVVPGQGPCFPRYPAFGDRGKHSPRPGAPDLAFQAWEAVKALSIHGEFTVIGGNRTAPTGLGEEGAMSDEAFAAGQKEVGEPESGYDEWFRPGRVPGSCERDVGTAPCILACRIASSRLRASTPSPFGR